MPTATATKTMTATSTPPKKSGRSQSPRAVERRRLQNRIAQRNHRRRVRESQTSEGAQCTENSDDGSNEEASNAENQGIGHQLASTEDHASQQIHHGAAIPPEAMHCSPSQDFSIRGIPSNGFMNDHASELKQSAAWIPCDPMLMQIPEDGSVATPMYGISQACGCDGMAGPCAHHMEQFQILQEVQQRAPVAIPPAHGECQNHARSSSLPRHPTYPYRLAANAPVDMPMVGVRTAQSTVANPYIPPGQPPSLTSTTTSATSSVGSRGSAPNSRSSPTLNLSRKSPAPTRRDSVRGHSVHSSAPVSDDGLPTSNITAKTQDGDDLDNTARFRAILETVKAAGFADFDKMVEAYYTSHFEKTSLPDMAQRASRGRRLHKVVQTLHESSHEWPKWESRGLREGILESARMLCVDELEKISRECQSQAHLQVEALDNPHQTVPPPPGIVMETETAEMVPTSRLNARLASLPDSVDTSIQDGAPHLWSLLTDLAGPQDLYCDRVSQAMLSLLIDARQSQDDGI